MNDSEPPILLTSTISAHRIIVCLRLQKSIFLWTGRELSPDSDDLDLHSSGDQINDSI